MRRLHLTLLSVVAGCGDSPAPVADPDGAPEVADAVPAESDASPVGEPGYPTPTDCVVPEHPVPCSWAADTNLDGEPDKREVYEFDDDGRLIEIIHYSGADIQQRDLYTYDGDELVEHELRNWEDVVGYRLHFAYEDGWVVEQTVDEDGDGSIEIRHVYERDVTGALETWTIERAGEALDTRFTFLYEEGKLVELEYDVEPYGSGDVHDTFTYDDGGRVARYLTNGTAAYWYEYDDLGREVYRAQGSGGARSVSAWHQDECTPSITISTSAQPPQKQYWSYNADGDLVEIESDNDLDGDVDTRSTFDYSCSPPTPPASTRYPTRLGGAMPRLSEFPELYGYWEPMVERQKPALMPFYEPVVF